jgi:tRNA(Ile)-lysidine synthase
MRNRETAPILLRVLSTALNAVGAPETGDHLLVAVSGGPDSTALLAGLAEVAPARRLRLTAVYIDHGLRGAEGPAEAAAVGTLAARLGAGFVTRSVAVGAGPGLEARARWARYRAVAALASEVGAGWIVTGHTRDDQVETMLLRLLRGAGRGGLAGMRPVRGRLFRPLLAATRADVRRFLAERGLSFAVDRSNADLRLVRNRVRRLIVPLLETELNPRLGPSLAALARRLRDEDDLLAALARERGRVLLAGDALRVDVAREPPALARRIIRAWLEKGVRRSPSAEHIERVLALAGGAGHGPVSLPGPGRVLREGHLLVRRPGRAAAARSFSLRIAPGEVVSHPAGAWRLVLSPARPRREGETRAADATHALFDADALPSTLVVRSPAPGDRLRLLGGGTRKLQDVLVDAKVPRETRPDVPVLASETDILWVAGHARGRGAAIGPATAVVVEGLLERGGVEP